MVAVITLLKWVVGVVVFYLTFWTAPITLARLWHQVRCVNRSYVLAQLRQLIEVDLQALEKKMEAAGAPWTP